MYRTHKAEFSAAQPKNMLLRSARWNCFILYFLFWIRSSAAQLPVLQSNALYDLKNSIVPADLWNTAAPDPCGWPGVTCNAEKTQVNTLVLDLGSPFQITIPPTFSDLLISRFEIYNANLTGPLTTYFPYTLSGLLMKNVSNIVWNPNSYLMSINVQYCDMNSLPLLSNFPALRYYFHVGGSTYQNKFVFACPQGHPLFQLKIIQVQFDNGVLPDLTSCKSLAFIDLLDLGLTGDIRSAATPSAYQINLSGNHINGTIPTELTQLTSLANLNLNGNQLSGTLDPGLITMPSLYNLALGSNRFEGTIPDVFGTTNLRLLILAVNNITGTIPPSLATHTALSMLDLQYNQLSGKIPEFTAPSLSTLRLNNNQFNGTIPNFFRGDLSYFVIDLSNNQLTGTIPPSLYQVRNITTALNLANNRLSGCVQTARYVPVSCNLTGNNFCCQSNTPLCPIVTNCVAQCTPPKPSENATCIIDNDGNSVWLVNGDLIVSANNTNTTIQNGVIDGNLITITPVTLDGVVVIGNLTVIGDLTVNNGIISVKGCAFVNGSLTLNLTPEEIEQLTLNGTITRDLIQYDALCSDSSVNFNSITIQGEVDCTELVGKQQSYPGLVSIVVTASKVDCSSLSPNTDSSRPTPTMALPDWGIGVIVAGACLIVGVVILAVLLGRKQLFKKKERRLSQRMASQSQSVQMIVR